MLSPLPKPYIANNTTPLPNFHSPNPVSWPSIFWALITLMLNSLTQPAGRLSPHLSQEQSLYLRASPIVCGGDALLTLVQCAYYAIAFRDGRLAVRYVSRVRMEGAEVAGGRAGESKHTGSGNPGGGFKGLQQNGFFRAMIFIFGALPQAVKIFACTGIEAWPKVWAVMFLGSFLVLEVLVVIAARTGELSGKEVLRTRATNTEVLDRIVVLSADAIVSLSKLPALFFQGMTIVRGFVWIRHGEVCFETSITVGLFVGSLCMTLFFPLGSYVNREVVMKILLHLMTVVVGNGAAFWLRTNGDGNTEDNPWLLALNVGLLFFAGLLGSIVWSSPASEQRNKFDKRIGVSFLLTHSLTAWGYHVLKMSNFPQSKKPTWAEYLG